MMHTPSISYKRQCFAAHIIAHAVWLYVRFNLSLREVEEMLLERGIDVSYETIRRWTVKFGQQIARNLRHRQARLGEVWHLDEVVVKIAGRSYWLWRAVDQKGVVLEEIRQSRRHKRAATRLLVRLIKRHGKPEKRIAPSNRGIKHPAWCRTDLCHAHHGTFTRQSSSNCMTRGTIRARSG